jgi:hypothetical protein
LFTELLNILWTPILTANPMIRKKDLSVVTITWNLAEKNQKIFKKNPESFFVEVDLQNTHMIAITG